MRTIGKRTNVMGYFDTYRQAVKRKYNLIIKKLQLIEKISIFVQALYL